jgi:hypothetical protein
VAKKRKPAGRWPRVAHTVDYASITNPVEPGPKTQRRPVGNRTALRSAKLIGYLEGKEPVLDDSGRVVGRIKPTPATLAGDVRGRAGQKLKTAAYRTGYGLGSQHLQYRIGMSLALWATTARKGGKGDPAGSLAYRKNIAARLLQMRKTGDRAGTAGYMAKRAQRSQGSFKSRKGTWRKKGGRFIGSGG